MLITSTTRYILALSLSCLLISLISACTTPSRTSESQWEEELQVLRTIVNERYDNPIFENLFAKPKKMNDVQGGYEVGANFITITGRFVEATYDAGNILDTLQFESNGFVYGERHEVVLQEQHYRSQILDHVTISPQDSIAIAMQRNFDFYTDHKSDVFILTALHFEPRVLEVFDTQAVWLVSFYVSASEERFVWIDATTGKIVWETNDLSELNHLFELNHP